MKSYKRVRWRLHGLEARGRQGKYWKPKWKRNRRYVQKGHMVDARGRYESRMVGRRHPGCAGESANVANTVVELVAVNRMQAMRMRLRHQGGCPACRRQQAEACGREREMCAICDGRRMVEYPVRPVVEYGDGKLDGPGGT